MSDGVTTQPSLSTRVKVWFEGLPFITRAVFVVCVSIYMVGALVGFDDYGAICLSADRVLWQGQVWRFVTAAVFHMGLLHVAFNMLAFVPIGQSLERSLGSVAFLHLILLLIVVGDVAYVFFSFVAAFGPASLGGEWVRQCAVGLSGVIFGLIVADNAASHATHRSIFGFFSVPAKWYPWALLVIWQLIMPGASFLGHLCGVLVGQLYVWGMLRWLLLPPAAVRWIETSRLCAPCYGRSSFIAASGAAATAGTAPTLPVSYSPPANSSAAGQGEQRGSWLSGGWLRLPTADTSAGTAAGTGLFGLGGAFGTGQATQATATTFSGQPRTIGAGTGREPLLQGGTTVPPPPMYPQQPTIAGGWPATTQGLGREAGSSRGAHASGSGSRHAGADPGGSGRPVGSDTYQGQPSQNPSAAEARAAAAAAAEARAARAQRSKSGGGSEHGGGAASEQDDLIPLETSEDADGEDAGSGWGSSGSSLTAALAAADADRSVGSGRGLSQPRSGQDMFAAAADDQPAAEAPGFQAAAAGTLSGFGAISLDVSDLPAAGQQLGTGNRAAADAAAVVAATAAQPLLPALTANLTPDVAEVLQDLGQAERQGFKDLCEAGVPAEAALDMVLQGGPA